MGEEEQRGEYWVPFRIDGKLNYHIIRRPQTAADPELTTEQELLIFYHKQTVKLRAAIAAANGKDGE